ncbi:MAG: glycosyltransferase, partial [Chloroflexota bacterium]|nr:glycosyltransferase [Chloroflexota bacterium]
LAYLADTQVFAFIGQRLLRARLRRDDETILAMNPIIDVAPALLLKRERPRLKVACAVRGRPAWELSQNWPWLSWLLYRLERSTLLRSDIVLANGFDTQEYLAARGVPSLVVPNGVDVERFARATEAKEAAWLGDLKDGGCLIIMMVATLMRIKGVHYLIRAAGLLRQMGADNFRLVLVGDGPQEPFRRQAERLGVGEHVRFAGQQRNIPAFLRWADISVQVSEGGGMSMAALESMAAGKALVAWDTPVYRQLVESEVSGLLVPHHDVRALAQGLLRLMRKDGLRQELGRRAQEEAGKYDWDRVTRELLGALDLPCPEPFDKLRAGSIDHDQRGD